MAEKDKKKNKKDVEFSKELNASEISWKLFEKTNDVNFYRLYSAIKDDRQGE